MHCIHDGLVPLTSLSSSMSTWPLLHSTTAKLASGLFPIFLNLSKPHLCVTEEKSAPPYILCPSMHLASSKTEQILGLSHLPSWHTFIVPRGFYTCYSLCLDCFSTRSLHCLLPVPPGSKCPLPGETLLHHLLKLHTIAFFYHLSFFAFFCVTQHWHNPNFAHLAYCLSQPLTKTKLSEDRNV